MRDRVWLMNIRKSFRWDGRSQEQIKRSGYWYNPKTRSLELWQVKGERERAVLGSIHDSKFFNGSQDNIEDVLSEFEKSLQNKAA